MIRHGSSSGEAGVIGSDVGVSRSARARAASRPPFVMNSSTRREELLLEEGTLRDHLDVVMSFDDFSPIVDLERHYGLEARYAGPSETPRGPAA